MSLRLYPPGTRNDRWYVARGRVHGRLVEIVCRDDVGRPTRDARVARQFVRRALAEADRRQRGGVQAGAPQTFAEAAERYLTGRNIGGDQETFVRRLITEMGHLTLIDVRPAHIAEAAASLYPTAKNSSKNRMAYGPAAAVLHYAADNDWCQQRRIRKLPEPKPELRRPAPGTLTALIGATDGYKRLFLLVVGLQGMRLSETTGLRWDKINLQAAEAEIWIPKPRAWKVIALHPETVAALASVPEAEKHGPVFPWRSRSGVYNWLRPLARGLGLRFTPHMARHAFAGELRELGATDADIADAGTWTSPRSVARYAQAPRQHARRIVGLRGGLWGTTGKAK